MTILIAGASGLLGRGLVEVCNTKHIDYIGTYFSRKIANAYYVNFNDEDELYQFMIDKHIHVCINCIVERQIDVCETNWNRIKLMNIDMVTILSRVCSKLKIHLVHISTDYVFDGKIPPYYCNTEVNPLQNYGISKLLSEKRIIANTTDYTIIRVPVLYSDKIENLSENAVSIIGKKVLNQIEETQEDDYSIRRPVFIPDFCIFIIYCVQFSHYGIYHYYNPIDKTTKYNIAKQIGDYLGKSISHIKPNNGGKNIANRPYDTELKDDKYDINQFHRTRLQLGIQKCFAKWKHPIIRSSTKNDSLFLMLDLDGTLLNTDKTHYIAYSRVLREYNIYMTYEEFEKIIHFGNMDTVLNEYNLSVTEIKDKKRKAFLEDTVIEFMSGAESFLEYLIDHDINFVIVTNTSSYAIEHYKKIQPLLQKITKWICKEDYTYPKPNSECYKLAINKYYTGEMYKIGFENTKNGYDAIKNEVNCTYFISTCDSPSYPIMKNEDVYIISEYKSL